MSLLPSSQRKDMLILHSITQNALIKIFFLEVSSLWKVSSTLICLHFTGHLLLPLSIYSFLSQYAIRVLYTTCWFLQSFQNFHYPQKYFWKNKNYLNIHSLNNWFIFHLVDETIQEEPQTTCKMTWKKHRFHLALWNRTITMKKWLVMLPKKFGQLIHTHSQTQNHHSLEVGTDKTINTGARHFINAYKNL